MTDRPPKLTLVGMPAFVPPGIQGDPCRVPPGIEADPFPLTPYADVHVYTPSRERTVGGERTPIILPPATPRAKRLATQVMPRPPAEPSLEAKMVAGAIVLWVMLMGTIWLMF